MKQDINCLENVQRRCQRLCLESLEIERRKQQDIVEAYKFITRKYKTLTENLFEKPHRQLRGHSWKLFKNPVRTEVSKNFFTHRIVDLWNDLPEEIVNVESTEKFRRLLRAVPLYTIDLFYDAPISKMMGRPITNNNNCCQTRLLQLSPIRYFKKQHNEVTACPERPGSCRSTEEVGIALGTNVDGVALASHCPAHRLQDRVDHVQGIIKRPAGLSS